MQDEPRPAEILQAVSRFIKGSDPNRIRKYDLRVAANALDLAARQIEQEARCNADETARLTALLGRGGTLEDLNRALCDAIRSAPYDQLGRYGAHLMRTTLEKLAVDQPTYSTFVDHARASAPDDKGMHPL